MKQVFILILLLLGGSLLRSQEKDTAEIIEKAKQFIATGNDQLVLNGNFPQAEADYRKAIHTNPESTRAKYNLANAYYNSEKFTEATQRFNEAIKIAKSKDEKHRAFHNLGNSFMEQKKYKEAVEAYKNALRNNSTDEETRYNLALAKKMLEQQEQENEQNKDNKDDQENKDQKDQNEENKEDDSKEGDNKEDQKDQGKDGDQGDKKEDKGDEGKSDEEKEGEDQKGEDGQPKEEEEGKEGEQNKDQQGKEEGEQKQPAKPVPGQLSPQQVKNLLEAMNNQEKKVQGKINAEKVKGAKIRTEKDW
ncbi:tetratricopeptide repeat protein [Aquimarina sp. ERC-38]|uniref:tetratricopeptide repeat protein n=1 Tax=Aquimarina sp. ERC-38 TaxID=2949996 RepID=UPI0022463B55|nr:tetratricopeptide repeat protein [Aquimarina sp. ERC-38]UZO82014.1 tetratricopeptide repeat protein [Aquimarina sp. ERC-38]